MQKVKPWHEQDTFWETVAPVLFVQRRWSDAPAEVEQTNQALVEELYERDKLFPNIDHRWFAGKEEID